MFTFIRLFLCLFAASTFVGGVVGFAKARSKASLIAGGVAATLLLASAWLTGTSHSLVGLLLGGLVSLLLAGRFAPAYRKSRKLIPAGIMVGFSLASLSIVSLGLVLADRESLAFAGAVKTADSATAFEGLPHQSFELELYAQERAKPVKELLEYPFYEGDVELTAEDLAAVRAILAEPANYGAFKGEKKCGGFHPDWAIEWTLGSERFIALVCFGCHEVKLLTPHGESRHDFDDDAMRSLAEVLRPYRKNRPQREQG